MVHLFFIQAGGIGQGSQTGWRTELMGDKLKLLRVNLCECSKVNYQMMKFLYISLSNILMFWYV
jgi:hypothetical protein